MPALMEFASSKEETPNQIPTQVTAGPRPRVVSIRKGHPVSQEPLSERTVQSWRSDSFPKEMALNWVRGEEGRRCLCEFPMAVVNEHSPVTLKQHSLLSTTLKAEVGELTSRCRPWGRGRSCLLEFLGLQSLQALAPGLSSFLQVSMW